MRRIFKPILPLAAMALLCACQQRGESADEVPPGELPTPTAAPMPAAPPPAPISPSPTAGDVEPDPSQCGADKLQRFLNLLPTLTARKDIAAAVGDKPIRYIEPGDIVTQDMRPERLNVETGVDGRIKRFRCG